MRRRPGGPTVPPARHHHPEGYTYETYLRHLTEEGLQRRYGERADDPVVQQRKEHELQIIHEMGFDIYFLIVWDLCNFARSRNIWWNVRGSGAGSLVAYAIGITNLDPLRNKLIFERFLNPGRVTMPDFDLDFPDDQREEMIRYTVEKYGADQVAQIVTFGRMKARGRRARRGPRAWTCRCRCGPHRQADPRHPRQAGDDPGRA